MESELRPTGLPGTLTAWHWLSDPGRERSVARALFRGAPVVVRLEATGEDLERRAELAVLAAVDHPGLARLVDHGSLSNGGAFLVRSWVEGQDLATWARGRSPQEAGRVVARLGPALDHLHRRGFVHGDLKATNVIVREGLKGPEPVLTDFGLSRPSGEANTTGTVSGTLFHVAPEVLLGASLTPAADLFALGAMLHELLVGRRPSAREFYGRFPREDFFAATRTSPEDLPAWARDLVASLLARDPSQRPASAARLGRTLAGRLGLAVDAGEGTERLRWAPMLAREAWREEWYRQLARAAEPKALSHRLCWVSLPEGEDAVALTEALALHASLQGASIQRFLLVNELQSVLSSAAMDAWAAGRAEQRGGRTLFAALDRSDPWQVRGLEALARAVLGHPVASSERVCLIAVGQGHAPDPELGWLPTAVPPIQPAEVEAFLTSHLAAASAVQERERIQELARLVCDAGWGTAAGIDRALEKLGREGWLLAEADRPRLRPGPLPPRLALWELRAEALGGDAALLWAALQVAGGGASIDELATLAGLREEAFAEALEALGAQEAVVVRRTGEGPARVEALGAAGEGWASAIDEDQWRAMNARRARQLTAAGAPPWRAIPHQVAAGDGTEAALLAAARRLREEGLAELDLELVALAEGLGRARKAPFQPALAAERALAWCALGQAERAMQAVEPLRPLGESRVRALLARVEGQVAALRHAQARALECFEAARGLDPEDGGEALLCKAQLLFEARRQGELEALLADLKAAAPGALSTPVRNNLRAIEAMARFRRGEIAGARELLLEQVADAGRAGHATRGASLELNLATVERRAGDLDAALRHAGNAIRLYEEAGNLAGLAQARALRGGTLREAGRLREAEPELSQALALRERLGDRAGAAAVRGMLGLVNADRGHLRPAVEELERAAHEVRDGGRSHDALLLEARAAEVRARLGLHAQDTGTSPEAARAAEGDPRVLIARARAAWLGGDLEVAREATARACALGESLGLASVAEEASFLAGLLAGSPVQETGSAARSLTGEDRALCSLLAKAPLDVPALRALAAELEERGRDDRAARAWITLAARAQERTAENEAATRARALVEACSTATSAAERRRLEDALLGLPDPWPEDLVAWRQRSSDTDQQETEVIELLEINHRLLAQEDLHSLLGAIVEQALAVSGAQRGFLVLEQDGVLSVDTALDSRRGGIQESEVELSGSVLRQALETMQPVRVSNAIDDPLLGGAPSVIALELRSILCVPFRVDKTQRGVIYLDHRLREGAFDDRAERMLRLLADQAALAILQVRRLEEIRRLHRELSKRVVAVESDLKTARRELSEAGLPLTAGGLVGSTDVMRAVRHLLERAAPSKLAVLVSGESGTGKELAARALHELSQRAQGPFVSENCAALPASLIEAELFGARKGAYTGADRDREGLFERAHAGTLFLDEIGELPLDLQAKLLRVLETSEVRRLGDERARRVDFRLVAATNRDLEAEVAAGRFRSDLFYRLKGLEVHMPALAERADDIPALVDHFLRLQEREEGVRRTVSKAVLARLMRRPWPGNVRELFNEVARLCLLSEGDLEDPELVIQPAPTAPDPLRAGGPPRTLADLERAAIERALENCAGDKNAAARLLGISRAKIYQRLKEWREQDAQTGSGAQTLSY